MAGSVRVSVDISLFFILPFLFITDSFISFLLVFFCITMHELGHVAVALTSGGRVDSLRILPVGLNVSIDESRCDIWSKLSIFISGPLVNILLCTAGEIIRQCGIFRSDSMSFFISTNLILAVFNLLPVLPLDGGKILRELLAEKTGLLYASSFVFKSSVFLSILFIVLGIVQLLLSKYNSSLILIGIYVLCAIRYERKDAAFMNVRNMIYRRTRLLKKGFYPARDLVVLKRMHLGEILKCMDYDRFHLIHVLNDDLRLIKVLTEQEVIDAMLKSGSEVSFGEVIDGQL